MAAYTLEFARERLALWLEAEAAVATGQAYQIGTRRLERANLYQIREQIQYWTRQIATLETKQNSSAFPRARRVVLRDI